jgi:murein DD-endopeptidase MepM/ murein hydrolase activator NlpD
MDTNVESLIGQVRDLGLPQADSGDSPERLMEIAREFESIIIHQLLQQMRDAGSWDDDEDGELFGTRLMETIDVELARQLAMGGGMGLAEALLPSLGGSVSKGTTPGAGADPTLSMTSDSVVANAAVRDAAVATVTSDFGWRQDPLDGDGRFHAGVDLRAAYGHEVGAAQTGRVVQAGEQGGYGLTVVIEHRPGIQTRYAHLSSIQVQPGERVEARQTIGRAGQTGRATGTHVHFEVTQDGKPVDPATLRGGIDGLLKELRLVAD